MNLQCTVGDNFCFFVLIDFVRIAHHKFLWILRSGNGILSIMF